MANRYKSLLSNTGLVALSNLGSKLIVYFFISFYTAYLTTDEYGTASLLTRAATLLIPVISLGIADAVFRFAADKGLTATVDGDARRRKIFTAGLELLFFGALIGGSLSGIGLSFFDLFGRYVWLILAYVLCSNLHGLVSQYIRARGKFVLYSVQGIINTAVVVGLNILFLAGYKWGVTGYVLSIVIADAAATAVIVVFAKLWREIEFPGEMRIPLYKEMLKFALPLIPTTIFWWVINASDIFMLEWFRGKSVVGLYSVSDKIPSLLVMVCTIFITAWNYAAVREENPEQRSRFFSNVYACFQALLFIGGAVVIAGATLITRIMVAKEFYDSWRNIPILTAATVFSCLITFLGTVYIVGKKTMFSMLTALVGAAANIVMNLILIPKLGATGAALGTLIAMIPVFILRDISCRRRMSFNLREWTVCINAAVLGGQIAWEYAAQDGGFGTPLRLTVHAGAIVVMFALNAPPIYKMVRSLTRKTAKESL